MLLPSMCWALHREVTTHTGKPHHRERSCLRARDWPFGYAVMSGVPCLCAVCGIRSSNVLKRIS